MFLFNSKVFPFLHRAFLDLTLDFSMTARTYQIILIDGSAFPEHSFLPRDHGSTYAPTWSHIDQLSSKVEVSNSFSTGAISALRLPPKG